MLRATLIGILGLTLLSFAVSTVMGAPPNEVENNNTRSLADWLARIDPENISGERKGELTAQDVDYYRFELSQSSWVFIETTSSGDTVLTLERENGDVLKQNDDMSYENVDSSLFSRLIGRNAQIMQLLQPGTYYVAVRGYGGGAQGSYVLHASALAGTTRLGGRFDGAFEEDEIDYYAVEITNVTTGYVAIWTESERDTILILQDADGRVIALNDDPNTGDRNARLGLDLAPGSYYVSVRGYQGQAVEWYRLRVERG